MTPEPCKILITELKLSPRLQCRAKLDEENLKDFIEALERGDEFPPIIVFRIRGSLYIVDGHHRLQAALKAGHTEILAVVHDGTWHDAVRAALAANKKHGIRLSAEDRAAAVLLATKELPGESTRAIAELCGISHRTVGRVLLKSRGALPHVRKMIQGRDGKQYPARPPRPRHETSRPEPAAAIGTPAEDKPIAPIPDDPSPVSTGAPAPVTPIPEASLHPKAIMVRNFVRSSLRHQPAAAADIARVLHGLLAEIGKGQVTATHNLIPQP